MDKTTDKNVSNAITFLKGFLPFLIVAIHAYYPNSNSYNFSSDFSKNVMYFLSRSLTCFAVPTFFLVSGYLFFNKNLNKIIIKKKWKDRIKTLLIPYLIWNTLYLIFHILKPFIFKDLFEINSVQWNFQTISSAFWNFDGKNPIDAPLWYIRDLIIISLLTPLINIITKKSKLSILLWFACILFINVGFGFFSLGAWLSVYRNKINFNPHKLSLILLFSTIIFLILSAGEIKYMTLFPVFFRKITGLMGVFSIILFSINLIHKRINKILVETSFWVYASHSLIIGLIDKIIIKIAYPSSDIIFITYFFLKILLTYIVSISLYLLLKNYYPAFLNIIVGQRKK